MSMFKFPNKTGSIFANNCLLVINVCSFSCLPMIPNFGRYYKTINIFQNKSFTIIALL